MLETNITSCVALNKGKTPKMSKFFFQKTDLNSIIMPIYSNIIKSKHQFDELYYVNVL